MAAKRVLFIDRDGTLIKEAPPTYQVDAIEKLRFYPRVFYYMRKIATELDYELVMVTNQDGLGTAVFPEESFWPLHELVMAAFETEDIVFSRVLIDRSFPHENMHTRKPGTGMVKGYMEDPHYDIPGSFVIGDRITDMQMAKNMGCKGIWLSNNPMLGASEITDTLTDLETATIALSSPNWKDVYEYLISLDDQASTKYLP